MNINMNHQENKEALQALVAAKLVEIGKKVHADHDDPSGLFDEAQGLVDRLEAVNLHVPDELREYVAELEAEVVEDFYDNLPV